MMVSTYQISGMTCTGCQAKVQHLLAGVNGVKQASVDLQQGEASLESDQPLLLPELKAALAPYPKYQLTEKVIVPSEQGHTEPERTWLEIYKPILLVFGYIIGLSLLLEIQQGDFETMRWMRHFMGGFFIVFSFFKLLNLAAFADSYAMYDIVARKWKAWGYVYAFIELALGLAFLTGFDPVVTNLLTCIVMSVSMVGVLQSVLNKRKIRCACLGAVFNLPMSTVTIIEDGLMIVMSAVMLAKLYGIF